MTILARRILLLLITAHARECLSSRSRYPLSVRPRCFDMHPSETRAGSPKRPDSRHRKKRLCMFSRHVVYLGIREGRPDIKTCPPSASHIF
ncbi:hypothetical protein PMIN01_08333 [Paraphaeosphaeria minitans]|uniref:Secreted protein n=1 Tax=Paraphaeosphaeria minitans TaxID=565426 RepID=A0A9P6KPG2_9PLEO|nr:hypothetical protein PMIN01_08333 [Paraphaeosphaeria minitans]